MRQRRAPRRRPAFATRPDLRPPPLTLPRAPSLPAPSQFGATIVPISAIGADEGVTQVLDIGEVAAIQRQLPSWLPGARSSDASRIPAARRGVNATMEDTESFGLVRAARAREPRAWCRPRLALRAARRREVAGGPAACGVQARARPARSRHTPSPLAPRRRQHAPPLPHAHLPPQPLIAPAVPKRFYFLFGVPIETSPALAADREECQRVYRGVKAAVEGGMGCLLRKREADPYKELLPRLAYEASWGGQRQAPSFEP